MTPDAPLAGFRVAVTAERRREELGEALRRRGAEVSYGPAMRIVALADDGALREAIEECLAAPLDLAIATTGVGFRGWLEAAEVWGRGASLTSRLDAATILARGPKARGAIRAAGLRESWSPESESSQEMLAHLLAEHPLAGKRVAVQLHGDPLREVVDGLRSAGAHVIEVPVYRWAPPLDGAPLRRVLAETADGSLDAVTFTSAPAATSFLQEAATIGRLDDVLTALHGPVLCAGVGPVTARPLVAAGVPVLQPERARLGALVRVLAEELPRRGRAR